MREYRYTVDLDGRVFHDGSEITDAAVLRFFMRVMDLTPEGRYLVLCQGERNWTRRSSSSASSAGSMASGSRRSTCSWPATTGSR